ncbi:MAG: hypothetical protein K9N62_09805 [Verrucomicrobia bacterium]|jgi:uncharacterized repeat protein (TIGR04138 family)|nr:hypothetical protein [Verrucomicrobiota bacterium]
MQPINFDEVLDLIVAKDPKYDREAYLFLREGLDYAQKKIGKANKHEIRHITGGELLDGIREYGLSVYGPLTAMVLAEWGVTQCEDFGRMVFKMVEHGLLSKTDNDTLEDFKGGYEFYDAFTKPFVPQSKLTKQGVQSTRTES